MLSRSQTERNRQLAPIHTPSQENGVPLTPERISSYLEETGVREYQITTRLKPIEANSALLAERALERKLEEEQLLEGWEEDHG